MLSHLKPKNGQKYMYSAILQKQDLVRAECCKCIISFVEQRAGRATGQTHRPGLEFTGFAVFWTQGMKLLTPPSRPNTVASRKTKSLHLLFQYCLKEEVCIWGNNLIRFLAESKMRKPKHSLHLIKLKQQPATR